MAGDWITARVEHVAERVAMGPFGSSIKVETFVPEGVPVISGQHLHGSRVDDRPGFNFITPGHAEKLRNANVQRGDVIFTHAGNIGQVAYIPSTSAYTRYVISQRQFYLRPDPTKVLPEFLVAYFRSPEGQHKLLANTSQVGVPSIAQPVTYLRSLEIPLPPLPEQRAIAHILGTLDDKIDNLRRQNETLEAMARAWFKAWFVDFEPVRAKMEGRVGAQFIAPSTIAPTNQGAMNQGAMNCAPTGWPQHILDLFPHRLVDSELGEIPEGWEEAVLSDVATNPRRSLQPHEIGADTPYIALEHMPRRCIALAEWSVGDEIESSKFEFKRGEILFGKLRPYFHKVGVAPVDGVCSTDIVVIAPRRAEWFAFVLGHVASVEFVGFTNAGSTGTKMPRTSWAEMARYPIALPPQAVARAFTDRLNALVDRIIAGIHESRALAQLRDTLLPKLISGALRVKDAETFLRQHVL